MTSFNELPVTRAWSAGSPQSTPPALEEQPTMELISTGFIDFPDPDQGHEGTMMYYSNPHTPPSDGGYKDGTMTQESVEMWSRGLSAKFTEDNSDSVRPSPPSSSNGDEINPFQQPDEDGSGLVTVEIDEVSMTTTTQTTLNDIDL